MGGGGEKAWVWVDMSYMGNMMVYGVLGESLLQVSLFQHLGRMLQEVFFGVEETLRLIGGGLNGSLAFSASSLQ